MSFRAMTYIRNSPSVAAERIRSDTVLRHAKLEIQCARCKTPSDVDLAAMKHPTSTFVHDLVSRLRCRKGAKAGRRPAATLLQLGWQPRHPKTET
jgi:hypothetical protein